MRTISAILSLSFAILSSCSHAPPPKWDGEIWTVRSLPGHCIRKGSDGMDMVKPCDDPFFDGAAVITDFEKLIEMYYGSCVQWKTSN